MTVVSARRKNGPQRMAFTHNALTLLIFAALAWDLRK